MIPELDPAEWDFRDIPDQEVQIACTYEYARESATIQRVFSQVKWGEDLHLTDTALIQLHHMLHDLKLDKPWSKVRTEIPRPSAPEVPTEGQKEKRLRLNFRDLDDAAVNSQTLPIRPFINLETGHQVFVASINWRVSDNQLVEEFRKFLEDCRPEKIKEPNNRGKRTNSVWQNRLEWLGMMRLLHRFAPNQLEEHCPEAWTRYGAAAGLHGCSVKL